MEELERALAEYISVLQSSSKTTNRAEDRPRYQQHLAEAALMYAALKKDRSVKKLKELVASERHGYGWDYLDGPAGDEAEAAFNVFAKLVEKAT
jgi:hypothetical protein